MSRIGKVAVIHYNDGDIWGIVVSDNAAIVSDGGESIANWGHDRFVVKSIKPNTSYFDDSTLHVPLILDIIKETGRFIEMTGGDD